MKRLGFFGMGMAAMVGLAMAMAGPAAAQFYPDTVKADNPLSYWRFETSLTDEVGGNDLDPSVSPELVAGPGEGNLAFSTNQAQAWAAAFGAVDLFDLVDFTYEMWIRVREPVEDGAYVLMRRTGASEGSGENSVVFNYTPGLIEFRSTLLQQNNIDPPAIDLGGSTDWHHIAFVYTEDIPAVIAYLDGVEVSRVEAFLDILLPGHDEEIYVGATRTSIGQHVFDGSLDEIAIYKKALTADQIAAHYNASFPDDYAAAVTADEPAVYWRFEDTFEDEMGLYGLLPSGVRYVEGPGDPSNYALAGRVSNTDAPGLYGITSFSYELWFNPIGLSSQSYLLFRRVGGTQQAMIYAYNPERLEYFSEYDPNRPGVEVPNQTDQWHHAVFAYDDTVPEMRVYLNGELVDTREGAAAAGDGTELHIGGSDQGDNFNGYIDEVAIYDQALTPEQVQAHFNAPFEPAGVEDWGLF